MPGGGHPLDVATWLEPQREGLFRGETSSHYANMVGPFGGVIAAKVLNAVLLHPARLGEPVAFTVNYAGPIADGEFAVEARPARTNRSTQHWVLTMMQAEQTVLTATAVTALRRETWSAAELEAPKVAPPGDLPVPRGRRPVEWIHRYDMRFISGGVPEVWDGRDHGVSRTQLWMRDDPPRALDFASLTAMADVFFPSIWRRRARLVPLGTVSMTVYFHADAAQLAATGTGYLLGQAQAQMFRKGYFDHAAQLWNESGDLLATTHQVVYYKE